jgi:hypothetical protein
VHTGIRTVVASSTQCISLDIRNFYPISTWVLWSIIHYYKSSQRLNIVANKLQNN